MDSTEEALSAALGLNGSGEVPAILKPEQPPEQPPVPEPKPMKDAYLGIMTQSIDDETTSIINDLNALIAEIEATKSKVLKNSASAKAGIVELHKLGGEATKCAAEIRTRLDGIVRGAEAVNNL